jgi:hypothetical protein
MYIACSEPVHEAVMYLLQIARIRLCERSLTAITNDQAHVVSNVLCMQIAYVYRF